MAKTPEYLLKQIQKYLMLDIRNTSFDEIKILIDNLIIEYDIRVMNIGNIPLFRARKIEDNDEHKYVKDVWCPPESCVETIGRMNNIGESIFYAAFDPITAIKETNIAVGEYFTLSTFMLYETIDSRKSSIILGLPRDYYDPSQDSRVSKMIIHNFIFNEFTRAVGKGTEYLYKASCAISHNYWKLPHKDSLIYPSMKDFKRFNIGIKKSSAKSRAVLEVVFKCKLLENIDDGKVIVKLISVCDRTPKSDENILDYDERKGTDPLVLTYSSLTNNIDYSEKIKESIKKICI